MAVIAASLNVSGDNEQLFQPPFDGLYVTLRYEAVCLSPLHMFFIAAVVGFFQGSCHARLIRAIKHLLILVNFSLNPRGPVVYGSEPSLGEIYNWGRGDYV